MTRATRKAGDADARGSKPAVVFDDDEDDDDSTIAIQQPSLVLERRSLTHWALCFYLPVALVTYAHCASSLCWERSTHRGPVKGPSRARRPIGAARALCGFGIARAGRRRLEVATMNS